MTVLLDTSTLPARDRGALDAVAQSFVHAEINFATDIAAAAVGVITDLGNSPYCRCGPIMFRLSEPATGA